MGRAPITDHRRLRRHPDYAGPERTRTMLGLLDVYLTDGRATIRSVSEHLGLHFGTISRAQLPALQALGLVASTPDRSGTLRPTVVPLSLRDAQWQAIAEDTLPGSTNYTVQTLSGPDGDAVAYLERWPQEGHARFTRLRADGQPCARSAVFPGQPDHTGDVAPGGGPAPE